MTKATDSLDFNYILDLFHYLDILYELPCK